MTLEPDDPAKRRCRGDQGSFALEVLIIGIPASVMLLVFGLFAWRTSAASGAVRSAAQHGARAATLRDSAPDAEADARASVMQNLAVAGVVCNDGARIGVDTSRLGPGGSVTVTVTCRVSNRDISGLVVPGSQEFSKSSTQAVDTWRSTGP